MEQTTKQSPCVHTKGLKKKKECWASHARQMFSRVSLQQRALMKNWGIKVGVCTRKTDTLIPERFDCCEKKPSEFDGLVKTRTKNLTCPGSSGFWAFVQVGFGMHALSGRVTPLSWGRPRLCSQRCVRRPAQTVATRPAVLSPRLRGDFPLDPPPLVRRTESTRWMFNCSEIPPADQAVLPPAA